MSSLNQTHRAVAEQARTLLSLLRKAADAISDENVESAQDALQQIWWVLPQVLSFIERRWSPSHSKAFEDRINGLCSRINGRIKRVLKPDPSRPLQSLELAFGPIVDLPFEIALKDWVDDIAALEGGNAASVGDAMKGQPARPSRQTVGGRLVTFEGYAAADTIMHDHGIPRSRLSEGKRAEKIRWNPAPAGIKDSQGRTVRVMYHVEDALKYTKPKHVKKRTRRKLAGGNS